MAKKEKSQMSAQEKKVADSKRDAEKQAKFVSLASKRMDKALKAVANLGNLSNRGSYSYTSTQSAQMIRALAEAVKAVESRFAAPTAAKGGSGFQFSA